MSGKGGGTTSLQEEIAGISRKMAHKYTDDTPEQHKERIAKYIKENYGDTPNGKARFDLESGHCVNNPKLRRVANPTDISQIYRDVLFQGPAVKVSFYRRYEERKWLP